ncbi:hypothetical protein BU14_0299s0002 [Porphyra umbilicalis]|uniref:Uncharacterized protein n=1 Tax=Porphyra umbilicalis TaxID=2786 RepID=A0A1X6P047_PORUM|nr:hypothetical protein BU14_0299s0002 [Porphyra umbilicalis]|eukprot:OSX74234.1 hypothetical protein BU14_0299s0002 [Porphyra umbilicalis]
MALSPVSSSTHPSRAAAASAAATTTALTPPSSKPTLTSESPAAAAAATTTARLPTPHGPASRTSGLPAHPTTKEGREVVAEQHVTWRNTVWRRCRGGRAGGGDRDPHAAGVHDSPAGVGAPADCDGRDGHRGRGEDSDRRPISGGRGPPTVGGGAGGGDGRERRRGQHRRRVGAHIDDAAAGGDHGRPPQPPAKDGAEPNAATSGQERRDAVRLPGDGDDVGDGHGEWRE